MLGATPLTEHLFYDDRTRHRTWRKDAHPPAASDCLIEFCGALCLLAALARNTPQNSMGRYLIMSLAPGPFDAANARYSAQGGNYMGKMARVLHLDINQEIEKFCGAVSNFQIVDITLTLGN